MTMKEKIREIMLSEELAESEKLDRLHALIPADVLQNRQLEQGDANPTQPIKRNAYLVLRSYAGLTGWVISTIRGWFNFDR